MDKLAGLLSIFALVLAAQAYEEHSPMVGFMCNRPAMYKTPNGWEKDDSTDCLKDPVDILNYCRKVYPTLDVRNVVESSKKVTISKWCGFGHNRCHHEFTVRPFRCLVGSFQSDALLVPEHCLFDHIHDSKECKNYEDWNKTSGQSCLDRGMVQQSFAILQPCGIDRFNGVEFVCCPDEDDIDQFLHKEIESMTTTTSTTSQPSSTVTGTTSQQPSSTTEPEYEEVVTPSSTDDIYDKYLHNAGEQMLNEHEYFTKAKTELEKHHHEKVTKMMKEWAEARQHVQDLKSVDPKGASKLNKEITARFQKTYEALEQEGIAEKKQLVALHQQRVQAALNEKKRHAMEHYMDVISDEETDAGRILKALQHYVKAEEKDRLHSVNHFKHLKDSDPVEAEAVREQTLNHLDLIEARIQQAMNMLNRVPLYEKKVRSQIDAYLETFQPLDTSITKLLSTPIEILEPLIDELGPVDLGPVFPPQMPEEPSTPNTPDTPETPALQDLEPKDPWLPEIKTERPVKKEYYDEEVMEDEHDYVEINNPMHGNHFQDNSLSVNSYIKQEAMDTSRKFSAPTLAVAIGSVTVFIVIVVGIVVLRKRAQRVPSSNGFVEVDTAASPEEKHVANMQLNGYENPTYKYFEMNGNA